jgi:hypothetical protein
MVRSGGRGDNDTSGPSSFLRAGLLHEILLVVVVGGCCSIVVVGSEDEMLLVVEAAGPTIVVSDDMVDSSVAGFMVAYNMVGSNFMERKIFNKEAQLASCHRESFLCSHNFKFAFCATKTVQQNMLFHDREKTAGHATL